MMYGCIGEHLPHSFSREIHEQIGGYAYELKEIAPEALDAFMKARAFRGINVTIPYKQAVIPYLDEISDTAREIGAVNTIVNRNGRLYGDNTDAYGLRRLIERTGIGISGSRVMVLGTGGTSKTARYVAAQMGARDVLCVSRNPREGMLSYEAALRENVDVVINTTPCGMYPDIGASPISLEPFENLSGVVDVIYNPLRSRLVLEAMARGIPARGGLFMLVAQAVRAAEVFQDTRYPDTLADEIFEKLLHRKENLVLIGMPGGGKTTLAALLGERLSRRVVDVDVQIQERAGMSIPEIFERFGEAGFRESESETVAEIGKNSGLVIATGGGTVLRAENVRSLRQNGQLILLERPLKDLKPSPDRPLGDTLEKIERLYNERMPLYRKAADVTVPVCGTPEETVQRILNEVML